MCGITGIIALNNTAFNDMHVVAMNDAIQHRGPDGEGFLFTTHHEQALNLQQHRPQASVNTLSHPQALALGHRRLSILDLNASASQPMTDSTGRYWLVFNGEIYNHADLRKELELKGYHFKTDHSDTEVILNAYACWGVDCLQKFNGMWAFCLWDTQTNQFFMARDRAGKKPFYYTVFENKLFFASEMKALLSTQVLPTVLDEKAVYDFLTYMMVPAPRTIFKDIYKLPAAHYIHFTPGQAIKAKPFWSPLNNAAYLKESETEIIEGIRERLYQSAKLRMVADVGVGVLLSGGVDSSANLACLSKFSNRPIKAFSVGFENKGAYTNEFYFARKVAKHFEAEYHELTLSEDDFFEFFPKMVHYQDEPIADPANIPIYYISKVARENNVKVLLGGEGSDELFVGYEHWKLARTFGNLLEGRRLLAGGISALHGLPGIKQKRTLYHGWYNKIKKGQPVFWSGTELRTEVEKRRILSKDYLTGLGDYTSFESKRELYEQFKAMDQLDRYDWMSAVDLQYRLPDLLLARLDRMMMAASVEGRNPFLDVNLIEYVMRIPAKLKTKRNTEKYLLKKAFEGILPNEILYRKKDSFTVPMSQLFLNPKHSAQSIEAIHAFNASTGIFNTSYIQHLTSGSKAGEFWNIANLALWYNQNKHN